MTYHIKDALKKQFDLLSEASEGCVDGEELSSLTHAMLQVCEFLERIERDEAAQHGSDTVSYTHLDVYKRQVFRRRAFLHTYIQGNALL